MTEKAVIGHAVIQTEVDASGVEAGLTNVRKSIDTIGKAGAAAGKAASEGLAPATQGLEKLNAEQRRFIASLEKQATLATQGKAAYLEQRAAQLGVSAAVADNIAKLKEQEAAQKAAAAGATASAATIAKANLGVADSARQAAYQMRQVAPQVTDIFTSLQAGQAPLTVLIQQGGQLKDVFGGVGPAARALSTYLLALVNPYTVAAAAAAVFTTAAYQGRKELEDFQKASILNGNALGLSVSGFTQMREAIAGIGVTKGKAAEVLTEIASNAGLAGANVRLIGEAAILMEKATGQATAKTLETFAELRKSPAEAAAKLNEAVNFLTAAQYRQIKALEDNGQKQAAADVAERAYADALKSRSQRVIDDAGLMEKAWRGLAGTAKGAWDAMLGIGREDSLADRLAKAADNVQRIQAQLAGTGAFGDTGGGAATGGASANRRGALVTQEETARIVEKSALRRFEIETQNTQEKAEQNRLAQLGIVFTKEGEAFLTKAQQRERELTKAKTEGQQLVRAGIITETQLQQRLQNVRDKYNDTTGDSGIAAQRAAAIVAQQEIGRIKASITSLDFTPPTKLTEAEQKVILIQEQLKGSLTARAKAQLNVQLATAQSAITDERYRVTLEKQRDLTKAATEETTKQVEAATQAYEATRQQALEQEAANATFGKAASAVAEYRLQQQRATLAEAEASDRFDPRYIASLRLKTEAQERYVEALKKGEDKQFQVQTRDLRIANKDDAELLQLEMSLIGRIGIERDQIVAARRVELEYARKIAEVDRSNLTPGDKAARVAELNAEKVVAVNNATTRTVLNDWQRTSDSINQSLTDALLRGFEAGKGFGRNFFDTLKNIARTTVLRPIISAITAPFSGAVGAATQSLIGRSVGSAVPGAIGASEAGGFAGLGGLFGATEGAGAFTGATSTGLATVAGEGAAGAGLLAAIPGWGWAALGALAIASLVSGKGGGAKQDGRAGSGLDSLIGAGDNSLGDKVKAITDATKAQYDAISKALGGTTGAAQFGLAVSTDPRGSSPSFVESAATVNGSRVFQNLDRGVGRSDEALTAALDLASKQALLKALQASNLPGELGDYINTVTASSSEAIAAAIERVTKAVTEKATLEDRLFDLTATDEQKLARTRDRERAALDATNLSLLEQVYQQEDLRASSEKAKASISDLSQTIESALSSYRTNTTAGLGRNAAFAQIQTALAIAKAGGPLTNASSLKDAIGVLSQANEGAFSSRSAFISSRASEAALLRQLQDAYSGTVTTPGVSAAQAAANQAQTTAATVALLAEQQRKNAEMQATLDAMAADTERSRAVLEAVVTGNATFFTELGSGG